MKNALEMALMAFHRQEVPIGAIIVSQGRVIARAHNLTRTLNDPTAHAEMIAIRRAAEVKGDWRLSDCTLYSTVEPCIQCAGAILLARIHRLVYGCPDTKFGAVSTFYTLCSDPRLNHQVSIQGGVLQEEAAQLLRSFFRNVRKKKGKGESTGSYS